MKYDEFAFVNQQLAGMLKSGIPLEGALRELCATMRSGALRTEFQLLEADLAQGTPLQTALAARRLPEFYVIMMRVGIASGDLPGVLTLLADYYQQSSTIWTRLKGLMVYPLFVLGAALGLSLLLSSLLARLIASVSVEYLSLSHVAGAKLWIAPVTLTLLVVAVVLVLAVPVWRCRLRWMLPGFRDAHLAQVASSLALLLSRGCTLKDALALLRQVESRSPAGAELAQWEQRLAGGQSKVQEFAAHGRVFPPLFVWLAASGGEDLAAGFKRTGEIYYARAAHRIEMQLYAFLPISVLFLGLMIVGQVYPLMRIFGVFGGALDCLGGAE